MPETQIILGPNDEEIKFPIDMPISEIEKVMQKKFGIKQNKDTTQNITQEVPPIPDVIVPERPRLKDPLIPPDRDWETFFALLFLFH